MPAEPDLDVGGVGSPERRGPARQVGKAEAKSRLWRDADVFAAEMTYDHCTLGFTWAGNSYVNTIAAILGPACSVVTGTAAMILKDIDRLGL